MIEYARTNTQRHAQDLEDRALVPELIVAAIFMLTMWAAWSGLLS